MDSGQEGTHRSGQQVMHHRQHSSSSRMQNAIFVTTFQTAVQEPQAGACYVKLAFISSSVKGAL